MPSFKFTVYHSFFVFVVHNQQRSSCALAFHQTSLLLFFKPASLGNISYHRISDLVENLQMNSEYLEIG